MAVCMAAHEYKKKTPEVLQTSGGETPNKSDSHT